MTVREYFRTPETNWGEELVYGWVVRDEPTASHQETACNLIIALGGYLRRRRLGRIYPPVNVVLDERNRLVLAPDISVVFNDRLHYVKRNMWGPPTIAIEILSPTTKKRDRQQKLQWYRKYGVKEYWIVDVVLKQIELIDYSEPSAVGIQCFRGTERLRSSLLPGFGPRVDRLIGESDFDETTYANAPPLRGKSRPTDIDEE
jgi:Uma2 family endonuclease